MAGGAVALRAGNQSGPCIGYGKAALATRPTELSEELNSSQCNKKFSLSQYMPGYVRDFTPTRSYQTEIGAAVTVNGVPGGFEAALRRLACLAPGISSSATCANAPPRRDGRNAEQ